MKEEISQRVEKLRAAMAEKRLEGMLISDAANVRYMSGFAGGDSWLLVATRRLFLLTDFRYVEEAEKTAPLCKTVSRKKSLVEAACNLADRLWIGRLGFESSSLSRAASEDLARKRRKGRIVPVNGMVEKLREIKSAWEIERIEKAIAIQERAFKRWVRRIRPGQTEREMAMDLHYEMVRRCGAEDISFPIIVAEGANSSLPHARPGGRKLGEDSLLLVDFGACVEGYRSDLTRTFFLASIPDRFRRIHEIVAEAQRRAIEAVGPGMAFSAVDRAARKYIASRGYGRAFGHSTGHGIGLRVHESPVLGERSKGELRAGMVVTVEPGIYLPGAGGVRIEDDVLVTDGGRKVLSSLPRGLGPIL